MILLLNSTIVMAADKYPVNKRNDAKGTVAVKLTNLKYDYAVQNFYIGSSYIYITQRQGSTTHVSRCNLNGQYIDTMSLKNCGHGQTMEAYTYNGKTYLLVGCKGNDKNIKQNLNGNGNLQYWSLQIARVEYTPNKSTNSDDWTDYTDLHRFTYMNYANKTATSVGTTLRVAAAISQGNDTMIFRVQTEEGKIAYSTYSFNALNKLLDQNKSVDMRTQACKNACLTAVSQTGNYRVTPNGSFQGIELTGTSTVYVSGGNEGENEEPKIARMTKMGDNSAYVSEITIKNAGTQEIEGITVKTDGYLYYLIVNKDNKKNGQIIYKVPTSVFN